MNNSKYIFDNFIVFGKIGRFHGIKGWLRLFSFTQNKSDIFQYYPWFIKNKSSFHLLDLEKWIVYKKWFLVKFKNINKKNGFKSLVNKNIYISSDLLPRIFSQNYYWKDLIGCSVLLSNLKPIGYVVSLIETVSNDVLVINCNINKNFKKKILFPFIHKESILDVNLEKKLIKINSDYFID